jgi:hypothetical protein
LIEPFDSWQFLSSVRQIFIGDSMPGEERKKLTGSILRAIRIEPDRCGMTKLAKEIPALARQNHQAAHPMRVRFPEISSEVSIELLAVPRLRDVLDPFLAGVLH